ncbi:hypothetical protein B0H16DRAFT_1448270 [Mycena metata]|uniref:Uncharacterized protein n=1 Tax=Mycena metata TaxID=1033252 RepID=A0AAD7NY55_9AGAR|nr:hypothetical protein B0H16DRAFT_1448270 [Mycena metata]
MQRLVRQGSAGPAGHTLPDVRPAAILLQDLFVQKIQGGGFLAASSIPIISENSWVKTKPSRENKTHFELLYFSETSEHAWLHRAHGKLRKAKAAGVNKGMWARRVKGQAAPILQRTKDCPP